MRILVYPHDLGMGGSQLNAIELAAEVQALGHDVVVHGQPGVLVDRVAELGLEFLASPRVRRRPTPAVVRSLRHQVRSRGIQVVHGYEWPPTLEAVLACRGTSAVPVSTVLSMAVAPFIPTDVPLMVGTEQIRAAEQARGRRLVELMEPPIDTRLNSPDVSLPTTAFALRWGLDPEAFTVVTVARLVEEMKLEGILTALQALPRLAPRHRVQLLVVGGGPAEDLVRRRAGQVNAALGTRAVTVTGELLDPRPAYALADVVLGMGSSALRGMAFGKPLVVQGIDGFWQPLTAVTLPTFLWQGWYGQGPGPDDAIDRLADILAAMLDDAALRERMAALSLRTLRERFTLTAAAQRQVETYEQAIRAYAETSAAGRARAGVVAAGRFAAHEARASVDRLSGRLAAEDFNSRATLAAGPGREDQRPVVRGTMR